MCGPIAQLSTCVTHICCCITQSLTRILMTFLIMLENLIKMMLTAIYNFLQFLFQCLSVLPLCLVFMLTSKLGCGGGCCGAAGGGGGMMKCIISIVLMVITYLILDHFGVMKDIFKYLGYQKAQNATKSSTFQTTDNSVSTTTAEPAFSDFLSKLESESLNPDDILAMWKESSSPSSFEMSPESQSPQFEMPSDRDESQSPQFEMPSDRDESQSSQFEMPTDRNESQSPQFEMPTDRNESQSPQFELPTDQRESLPPQYEMYTDRSRESPYPPFVIPYLRSKTLGTTLSFSDESLRARIASYLRRLLTTEKPQYLIKDYLQRLTPEYVTHKVNTPTGRRFANFAETSTLSSSQEPKLMQNLSNEYGLKNFVVSERLSSLSAPITMPTSTSLEGMKLLRLMDRSRVKDLLRRLANMHLRDEALPTKERKIFRPELFPDER